jgi:hypothetical protein
VIVVEIGHFQTSMRLYAGACIATTSLRHCVSAKVVDAPRSTHGCPRHPAGVPDGCTAVLVNQATQEVDPRGGGYIECHHIVPLHVTGGEGDMFGTQALETRSV